MVECADCGRIVNRMVRARSSASGLWISTRTTTGSVSERKYAFIPTIELIWELYGRKTARQ